MKRVLAISLVLVALAAGTVFPQRSLRPPGAWGAGDCRLVESAPLLVAQVAPAPPAIAANNKPAELPQGVAADKLASSDVFSLSGRAASKDAVIEAIGQGGALVDDSKKPTLVVIGDDKGWRDKILQAVRTDPAFGEFRDALKLWDGPRTDWSFRPGFDLSTPTRVIVQDATGKVLHSKADVGDLAEVFGALRRAVPGYDPKRDPDLTRGWSIDLSKLLGNVTMREILSVGFVLAVGYFALRKDSPR